MLKLQELHNNASCSTQLRTLIRLSGYIQPHFPDFLLQSQTIWVFKQNRTNAVRCNYRTSAKTKAESPAKDPLKTIAEAPLAALEDEVDEEEDVLELPVEVVFETVLLEWPVVPVVVVDCVVAKVAEGVTSMPVTDAVEEVPVVVPTVVVDAETTLLPGAEDVVAVEVEGVTAELVPPPTM